MRQYRNLTDQEITDIKVLYDQGVPVRQIAKQMAVAPQTVRRHAVPASTKFRQKQEAECRAKARKLAKELYVPGDVGYARVVAALKLRGYDIPKSTVSNWLAPSSAANVRAQGERRRERDKAERHTWMVEKGFRAPDGADANLWSKAAMITRQPGRRLLSPRFVYEKYLKGVCELSGLPLVFEKYHPQSPELDRIVPGVCGGEYTEDNCRVVCRAFNLLRGAYDADDKGVLGFIQTIASQFTHVPGRI